MFGWLWGCMGLSFKVTIGGICWVFTIAIICLIIAGGIYALDKIIK